jgi:hypothetical protein
MVVSLRWKFQVSVIKVYVFSQIAGNYGFKHAKNIIDSILVQLIKCHYTNEILVQGLNDRYSDTLVVTMAHLYWGVHCKANSGTNPNPGHSEFNAKAYFSTIKTVINLNSLQVFLHSICIWIQFFLLGHWIVCAAFFQVKAEFCRRRRSYCYSLKIV